MIRAEAETCFEFKNENKYFHVTLSIDDWKFRAHKGPNNQRHKVAILITTLLAMQIVLA